MAHYLDASQLAEELNRLGLHKEEAILVAACQTAGEVIAQKHGIAITNDASNEPGFGGLCVGFGPLKDGDKCPDDFAEYDSGSDWAQGIDDEEADPPCRNCEGPTDDGEGWDGYCGNCADAIENMRQRAGKGEL